MIAADQRLFEWINSLSGTWPWLDKLFTFLASDFFLPVLIAAGAWSLWFLGKKPAERLRNQLGFVYAASGAGCTNWAIHVLNHSFYRPRPFLELDHVTVLFYRATDSSFPSNAAAFAFAMAAGVWLVNKRMGLAVGAAAFVFCAARVYAGMHYPLDSIGGALLGILMSWAFSRVVGLLRPVANAAFTVARALYLA